MKLRYAAAALLAAALAVGAATAGAGTQRQAATTLTVWLQVDAQSGWPDAVAAANKAFQASHPGVDVKIEYQQWNSHLTKFDASLAGGNAPDVIEMGNTEMVKYMAAKAFVDLTSVKSSFPNSSTWLKGLAASGQYGGKVYGVPYYAGARAIIYRTDLYKAAGIKSTPKSLDEFVADGQKLMKKYGKKDPNFSALYFPGRNWYAAMSYVYDYGGRIAYTKKGQWIGSLDSKQAVQALTKLKSVVLALSRASKTTDEANPQQATVFAKGSVAAFPGNGWEWPYALDTKVGNPGLANVMGAYPMPSHVKGKYMPTFLGGSDLAVPITTKNKDLAVDWIKAFTSTEVERQIASLGNIANTTSLAGTNRNNPKVAPFEEAAKFSWFVPSTPQWANVENANVLQDMLQSIFTNQKSVKKAATDASKQISQILNATGAAR